MQNRTGNSRANKRGKIRDSWYYEKQDAKAELIKEESDLTKIKIEDNSFYELVTQGKIGMFSYDPNRFSIKRQKLDSWYTEKFKHEEKLEEQLGENQFFKLIQDKKLDEFIANMDMPDEETDASNSHGNSNNSL